MQKIIIKEVHPAMEEKKPTIIVTEDGAKMSGFIEGLKSLTPGSIIEAELEVKGKYTNIKSFTFVSKPAEQPAPPPPPPTKPTGEQWGEKNKIERASIEAQTAVKAILSMPGLGTIFPFSLPAVDCALAWCSEKIKATMSVKPIPPPATKQPPTALDLVREAVKAETGKKQYKTDPASLKTITDMQKAVHKDFGLQPAQVMTELNVKSWSELTITPKDAYIQIAEVKDIL